MLHYAVVFVVIAPVAALSAILVSWPDAVEIAKILFFVFLLLFVASLVFGLMRRK